ncbi:MAG: hypothetical protein P8103_14330 [Candidatus Thiodiazotropha sp.]
MAGHKEQLYMRDNSTARVYMVREDEANLVDLWISLAKYKKQFYVVFVSIMLVSLIYGLFIYKPKLDLVTTLQIGTVEVDNDIVPIEAPSSLLSKIDNSILPKYTHEWKLEKGFDDNLDTITTNPKKTDIILISNSVYEADIDLVSEYQKGLVSIIQDDHKRMINSLKSSADSELKLAQLELEKLKNPITLEHKLKVGQVVLDQESIKLTKLEDERYFGVEKAEFQNRILEEQHNQKRLEDSIKNLLDQLSRKEKNREILQENISSISTQIDESIKNRRKADTTANELSAMSQMLIDNEIQQNQQRLLTMEERYYVDLENEKAALLREIEDARLELAASKENINLLNEKYDRLLVDNKFMREQQKLAVDEANLSLKKIKLEHENEITKQENLVSDLKMKLDNFGETRVVSSAVPSLKMSGLSKLKLVLISITIAVAMGLLVMFIAMFREKVKERERELSV